MMKQIDQEMKQIQQKMRNQANAWMDKVTIQDMIIYLQKNCENRGAAKSRADISNGMSFSKLTQLYY